MLVKAKSRKLKNMLEIQGVCNNIMPDPIVEKSPKRAYNKFQKLRKFEVGENNFVDEISRRRGLKSSFELGLN